MYFTIEINRGDDGFYEAICPDIGLSARAGTLEEVIDKIKNLVVFFISSAEEMGLSAVDEKDLVKQLSAYFKDKNFFLPRNPKIH